MHHHTTVKRDIDYNYYGKGKIPCTLIQHYGHHRANSTYNYVYSQDIVPINV